MFIRTPDTSVDRRMTVTQAHRGGGGRTQAQAVHGH